MLEDLKKLIKHTSIYGLGIVLSKAIGFLMIPLYTHYLTPSDYGVLELLDLTITVAGIFIGLGISKSIFRFYYQYKDPLDKREVISTALIFVSAVSFMVISIAVLNAPIISNFVFKSREFSKYLIWMFISLLFSTVASVPESHIMAQQRSTLFTTIAIVTLVINLSLNILVVAYLKMGVLGIVYVSAFVRALNTCFLLVLTVPQVGLKFSLSKLEEMLGYGLPLLPASIGLFTMNFADRFFLSHLSSLSSVGIYSLGYKFGFMISILIVEPFNRIWQAQLFELAEKKDAHEEMGRLFTYFGFVITFAVLGLSVLIKDVIKIVAPQDYWAAYKVVPLIGISYFFRGAYIYVQAGILLKRKTKYIGYSVSLATFLSLAMNYYLIINFDYMGAAICQLTTSLIMAALVFWFSTRLFYIGYEFIRIMKLGAVAFGLILIAYIINIEPIAISLAVKFAIAVSFPLMLVAVGFYSNEEKMKIISIMHNIRKKFESFGLFLDKVR
ncbi:MAG: lipopolysaccharide biosynthesis protein [Candidatus Hodarchaeota archaeon]